MRQDHPASQPAHRSRSWILLPDGVLTIGLCLLAGILHGLRLWRWRGYATGAEPLLAILHVAYGFTAISFMAMACAAAGHLQAYSALHVATVGAIGLMMLAVMGRATRGHTGRDLTASRMTCLSYACLIGAAVLRPFAEALPGFFQPILSISALLWMAAFGLFLLEYAPMLTRVRRTLLAG